MWHSRRHVSFVQTPRSNIWGFGSPLARFQRPRAPNPSLIIPFVAALFLAACRRDEPPPRAPTLIQSAVLEQNTNPTVPHALILHVQTDEPSKVTLDITGAAFPTHVEFKPQLRVHDLPVVGLVPGKTNTITLTVEGASKRKESKTLTWEADPLPPDFPPLAVNVSNPSEMEPGLTLFNVFQWNPLLVGMVVPRGWLIIVNAAGEVVWYQRPDAVPGDARMLDNGHLFYEYDQTGFVEIDILGNDIARWHATGLGMPTPAGATLVDMDTMHHDIQEMPNGHFLALSTAMIPAPHYPTSETDARAPQSDTTVIVDKVAEFDCQGTVIHEWYLDDLVDSYRVGYDSLSPFWDVLYKDQASGTKDWSHANALVYSAQDDSIVVSLRNQDALVKFNRTTGKLVWILSPPANWKTPWNEALLKAAPGTEWFYHQHAPKLLPDNRILLFDNGNFRASPPEPKIAAKDNRSRVVEYRIDETNKTIKQEWSYGGADTEIFYSPFLGDADALPKTGNVLITDGGRVTDNLGVANDAILLGHKWARVFEVTREAKPRKVFEVQIKAPMRWSVYRAERIPSLYR
jgi:arylsulfate sulfotransferase